MPAANPTSAPLPMPLEVDGDAVTGQGTTIVQVVVPLDRTSTRADEQARWQEEYDRLRESNEEAAEQAVDQAGDEDGDSADADEPPTEADADTDDESGT